MTWIITKYLLTAALVVLISEVAKLNDKLGAAIAALPLVTFLALIWLHLEGQAAGKIANHAWYTFWYVIPTLPMFLAFPFFLKHFGFWLTLPVCILITLACFVLFAWLVRPLGVELLP